MISFIPLPALQTHPPLGKPSYNSSYSMLHFLGPWLGKTKNCSLCQKGSFLTNPFLPSPVPGIGLPYVFLHIYWTRCKSVALMLLCFTSAASSSKLSHEIPSSLNPKSTGDQRLGKPSSANPLYCHTVKTSCLSTVVHSVPFRDLKHFNFYLCLLNS